MLKADAGCFNNRSGFASSCTVIIVLQQILIVVGERILKLRLQEQFDDRLFLVRLLLEFKLI